MSSPSQSLVRVRQLRKRFVHEGNLVEVLKGVDLEIDRGEMVCVVGKSGAGKSTLLHLLGTLDLPTSGSIEYEGRDVTQLPSNQLAAFRNERIGFVFQFHHLLPEFDAVENVMMPGLVRGAARAPLRKRALELLNEVGLGHRLKHRPGELSGGEQQRVALARAIVMEPAVVLADEPTGNLDSGTSDAIHRLFFDLNQSRGTTFLIVTHSRDLAGRMPRVVEMRDGVVFSDRRVSDTPDAGESTADASAAGEEVAEAEVPQDNAPPSDCTGESSEREESAPEDVAASGAP